jgi:hypothetical protein
LLLGVQILTRRSITIQSGSARSLHFAVDDFVPGEEHFMVEAYELRLGFVNHENVYNLKSFPVYFKVERMRLVRLSPEDEDFRDEKALHKYFTEDDGKLRARIPSGVFPFKKGWIRENGLDPGDTILFSYCSKLRYVAKATTSRTVNEYPDRSPKKYPFCFRVDLDFRKADISLEEVERRLHAERALKKSKSLMGQGWTEIPESEEAKKVIEELSEPVEMVIPELLDAPIANDKFAETKECVVHRYIRDTVTSRQVKGLYENTCQVCGQRLEIAPGKFYAEAHHLKPLGGDHKGPDMKDNILCLCPNHHALFDYFAISLDTAKLKLNKHDLRKSFVDYHNEHFRKQHSSS